MLDTCAFIDAVTEPDTLGTDNWMNNPDICYYHMVCKYNYWNIMKDGGAVIDAASIDGSLKEWVVSVQKWF